MIFFSMVGNVNSSSWAVKDVKTSKCKRLTVGTLILVESGGSRTALKRGTC